MRHIWAAQHERRREMDDLFSLRGKNAKPVKADGKGRRWKSLSDFVTGSCNRVAHASALSAVE